MELQVRITKHIINISQTGFQHYWISYLNSFLGVSRVRTFIRKWLYFLRHAGEEGEKMKVLLDTNAIFREADDRYKQFTADRRARMAADARSMFLHDQATRIYEARQEGLEEGEVKGKYEKAQETARKLLEENFEMDVISRVTGLSKKELCNL